MYFLFLIVTELINVIVDKEEISGQILYKIEASGISNDINVKDLGTSIIYSPVDGYIKIGNINPGSTKQLLFF